MYEDLSVFLSDNFYSHILNYCEDINNQYVLWECRSGFEIDFHKSEVDAGCIEGKGIRKLVNDNK